MTTQTPATSPAAIYLAGLSKGSQGMRQSLDIIAGILSDDHDAETFPWWEVTYRGRRRDATAWPATAPTRPTCPRTRSRP